MGRVCPEPYDAGRRPIDVNRKRWATTAAAAAVLTVLIGVVVLLGGGHMARPSSTQVRQAFGFDAAYADPDPMVLVIRYGDSSSCPSKAVRHDVLQQPGRVVVTLTRAPMQADQPCTSDSVSYTHLTLPTNREV